MRNIALNSILAKKTANPKLSTKTINVNELSKVMLGSGDTDSVEVPSAFVIPELLVLKFAPDLTYTSTKTYL